MIKYYVICALVVLVSGCGTTARYGNTEVQKNGDTTTYTDTQTGSKVEVNTAKLPDDFPKTMPILPDASVKSSVSIQGNISTGFETKKTPAEAWEWYQTELAKNGWTNVYKQDVGTGYISTWTLGDLSALVTIGSEQGKTNVGIVIGKK